MTAVLRFIKATDGNKKRGKAVVDSVSGNTVNCTVIYPFESIDVIVSKAFEALLLAFCPAVFFLKAGDAIPTYQLEFDCLNIKRYDN